MAHFFPGGEAPDANCIPVVCLGGTHFPVVTDLTTSVSHWHCQWWGPTEDPDRTKTGLSICQKKLVIKEQCTVPEDQLWLAEMDQPEIQELVCMKRCLSRACSIGCKLPGSLSRLSCAYITPGNFLPQVCIASRESSHCPTSPGRRGGNEAEIG